MKWFDLSGHEYENDASSELPEPEEVEVFPLVGIPVITEDVPIHDGVYPCGDPDCPCAIYGYGVPSLDERRTR